MALDGLTLALEGIGRGPLPTAHFGFWPTYSRVRRGCSARAHTRSSWFASVESEKLYEASARGFFAGATVGLMALETATVHVRVKYACTATVVAPVATIVVVVSFAAATVRRWSTATAEDRNA